jgi:hypothetical protein
MSDDDELIEIMNGVTGQIELSTDIIKYLTFRVTELEDALKPFADKAKNIDDEYMEGCELDDDDTSTCEILMKDFRNARKILEKKDVYV